MSRAVTIVTALALAGLLLVVASGARAQTFTFTNIIDPANPTFTQALGINSNGTVVGYGNETNFDGFEVTAPFGASNFTRENFPDPAPPPIAFFSQVVGIDAAGETIGFYVDAAGLNHGFTDVHGTFSTVDRPGTSFNQLLGINQGGTEIVGYSSTNPAGNTLQEAFSLDPGTTHYTDINSLLVAQFGANFNSQATGVNNARTVVGFYQPTSTTFNGFEDKGGTISVVTFPGAIDTMALGINNRGEIVGDYTLSNGDMFGFLDNKGVFSTLDPFGSTAVTANGINNAGDIVGFYTAANGDTIGFEASPSPSPTPEPGSLLLFPIGLAGLACVLARRRQAGPVATTGGVL